MKLFSGCDSLASKLPYFGILSAACRWKAGANTVRVPAEDVSMNNEMMLFPMRMMLRRERKTPLSR